MAQKISFKKMNLAICGTGRIDEKRPINLAEYTIGYSPYRNVPLPVMAVPEKVCFSKEIAGTVYDVTGSFDLEGKQTLLQQVKDMLLRSVEETQN